MLSLLAFSQQLTLEMNIEKYLLIVVFKSSRALTRSWGSGSSTSYWVSGPCAGWTSWPGSPIRWWSVHRWTDGARCAGTCSPPALWPPPEIEHRELWQFLKKQKQRDVSVCHLLQRDDMTEANQSVTSLMPQSAFCTILPWVKVLVYSWAYGWCAWRWRWYYWFSVCSFVSFDLYVTLMRRAKYSPLM